VFGPELVVMPAIVLVLVAIIAWGRRGRSAQLLALVKNGPTALTKRIGDHGPAK
jgi:hypothetical protein